VLTSGVVVKVGAVAVVLRRATAATAATLGIGVAAVAAVAARQMASVTQGLAVTVAVV
jgi:hypothetical protein